MKKYKFKAKVEAGDRGGACVFFPFDTEKEFGTKGRVPVKATFDGTPYAGSLIRYGKPQHLLPMLKAIREAIGKSPGDTVEVEVWKDEQPRVIEVPRQLESALNAAKVRPFFEGLSYTHQKEYCRWISDAKTDETRQKRIEKAIGMLRAKVKTPDVAAARSATKKKV